MTAALRDWAKSPRRFPAMQDGRGENPRPKLQVLDQAAMRRRKRLRLALGLLFGAVLVGFFGVAFVHAQLVAGQRDLDDVRTQIRAAEARRAELQRAVENASAPSVIVSEATERLGMVPAAAPVYLAVAVPQREVGFDGETLRAETFHPDDSPGAVVRVRSAVGVRGGIEGTASVVDAEPSPDVSTELAAEAVTEERPPTAPTRSAVIPDSTPDETSPFAGMNATTVNPGGGVDSE